MPPPGSADRVRVRKLLEGAIGLPPADRGAYLREHLDAGPELDEALDLIEQVEGVGEFLGTSLPATKVAESVAQPERIGQYRILRPLGWGSMGVVYLAEQEAPRRLVAVKLLRMDVAEPGAAGRFEREADVLAQLSHPGVARVLESGALDLGAGQQPFIAMEYIEGLPITVFAEQRKLSPEARVALVVRVAEAVAHTHARGVLHRDLKPENILVREDGSPCVLDFGVAQTLVGDGRDLRMTATGAVVGTLAYMAPEQARGATVDARADLFALGAILYELLTGSVPFDVHGRLPHEALRIVADGEWVPPARLGVQLETDLRAVLAGALAAEPARRYANVEAFAEDLGRYLEGRPVRARPPAPWESFRRALARHPRSIVGSGLLLLALGAAVAFAFIAALDARRESGISALFTDRQLLTELNAAVERLWPTSSDNIPSFNDWLASARKLVARTGEHRVVAASLLGRGGADVEGRGSTDWIAAEGARFVEELEAFAAPGGSLAIVESRAKVLQTLHRSTIEALAAEWRAAARRVAADERFQGLMLLPQEGLIPLGPDPHSGLEEFHLFGSGAVYDRQHSGSTQGGLGAEHGLVLVLIPGGMARIGVRDFDARRARGESVERHEGPVIVLELDPFLISKFEMTQAQWVRLFQGNPSDWDIGSEVKGAVVDGRNPVDSVTWDMSMRYLPRLALTLPTEAQWEWAARAGSDLLYLWSDDWESLEPYVNAYLYASRTAQGDPIPWKDGYRVHAPVGSFLPNPFGLYDVLGNVWECCLDDYKVRYHQLQHRPGDGLVIAEPDGDKSTRGAGFGIPLSQQRPAYRGMQLAWDSSPETGVRPARPLVLEEPPMIAPESGERR